MLTRNIYQIAAARRCSRVSACACACVCVGVCASVCACVSVCVRTSSEQCYTAHVTEHASAFTAARFTNCTPNSCMSWNIAGTCSPHRHERTACHSKNPRSSQCRVPAASWRSLHPLCQSQRRVRLHNVEAGGSPAQEKATS